MLGQHKAVADLGKGYYLQGFQFVGIWVFVGNLILKCGCCGYKKSVWVTSFENVGISEMWVFFCVGILISVLES